ncbi:hypothetical protein OKW23_000224 [Bacilli bacterium PM5-9]|nr:hypothetical protein [Bacilli bacterium PM5-9]
MQLKLNKYDIILTILTIIIAFALLVFVLSKNNDSVAKVGKVYYENNIVHTFDLNDNKQEFFEIEATNGLVKIEKKDGKIRVINETSRNNICSIQGWSNSTINPIVCLPNNLYIKIENSEANDEVDVFIK